jgi:hypothetical protein
LTDYCVDIRKEYVISIKSMDLLTNSILDNNNINNNNSRAGVLEI